jgi:hypothetical protein
MYGVISAASSSPVPRNGARSAQGQSVCQRAPGWAESKGLDPSKGFQQVEAPSEPIRTNACSQKRRTFGPKGSIAERPLTNSRSGCVTQAAAFARAPRRILSEVFRSFSCFGTGTHLAKALTAKFVGAQMWKPRPPRLEPGAAAWAWDSPAYSGGRWLRATVIEVQTDEVLRVRVRFESGASVMLPASDVEPRDPSLQGKDKPPVRCSGNPSPRLAESVG